LCFEKFYDFYLCLIAFFFLKLPIIGDLPLLNVHWVNDVRQTEIRTAEPLVPEPSASEIELAIEKLKSHISPGIDQIPAELIKARDKTIRCEVYKLIISI